MGLRTKLLFFNLHEPLILIASVTGFTVFMCACVRELCVCLISETGALFFQYRRLDVIEYICKFFKQNKKFSFVCVNEHVHVLVL